MANGLAWERDPEPLRAPLLIAGFEGWNDAADAASGAATWLTQHGEATRLASIDPEEHVDFQARRPEVELVDGVNRTIVWPESSFSVVGYEHRDLVVLRGIEPSYRWRSFCEAVTEVARRTGCEMVVTFGALLADVPHTRPARVTGTATDPTLVETLRLAPSRYEGPTGIVGVLHDHCRREGIPSVSLWAPVPHYLASPPNPPATLAILERFADLSGVTLDLERLEHSAGAWRRRVEEVAGGDEEVRNYVRTLEERFDAEVGSDASWGANLPSGDELARELERFLREQRDEP